MRILYVAHNVPPYNFTGGPLLARQYATLAMRHGATAGIAFGASEASGSEPIVAADGLHLFPVPLADDRRWIPGWTLDSYSAPLLESPDVAALKAFRPDLIHIVTWVNLPVAVLAAAKACGIPVIRLVCNNEDMCAFIEPIRFHADGAMCQAPLSAAQCATCLTRGLPRPDAESDGAIEARRDGYLTKVNAKWDAFQVHLREVYSELVFLSEGSRRYFESIVDCGRISRSTIEHGIVLPAHQLPAKTRRPDDPVRFVFLGPCHDAKGWDAIQECFAPLMRQEPGRMALRVFDGAHGAAETPLAGLPGVDLRDRFTSDELDAALDDCDVGLVPTKFDTFNRVCREMLARGIPVIGSDAIGMEDAIVHRHNGLQIGRVTAGNLRAAVRMILDEPGLLDILTMGARSTRVRSASEEFDALLALYARHLGRPATARARP